MHCVENGYTDHSPCFTLIKMAQIILKTHLIAAEHLIRSGRGDEARRQLGFLFAEGFSSREERGSIPPPDRAYLIQLLRRSGAPDGALAFSYNSVRGETAELTPSLLPMKNWSTRAR
jgi:hypothetical protein